MLEGGNLVVSHEGECDPSWLGLEMIPVVISAFLYLKVLLRKSPWARRKKGVFNRPGHADFLRLDFWLLAGEDDLFQLPKLYMMHGYSLNWWEQWASWRMASPSSFLHPLASPRILIGRSEAPLSRGLKPLTCPLSYYKWSHVRSGFMCLEDEKTPLNPCLVFSSEPCTENKRHKCKHEVQKIKTQMSGENNAT